MFLKQLRSIAFACVLFMPPLGNGAHAQDKITFTTSSVSMLNLPIYVADVMGFFTEQKIEPEIIVFKTGGATALAAVLGGNANVYIGAPSTAISAANKGADTIAFGAVITEFALNIMVHKEVAERARLTPQSSIEDRFRALKGLKIGVTGAGSATHQITQYALKYVKLDPERDATIVFVNSNEDMQAAFLSKRIDAVTTANPASDEMERSGSFLLVNGAAGQYPTIKGLANILLIGTKRWISEKPDRTTRLLVAIKSAEAVVHDQNRTTHARDLVAAKYFPQLDKAIFDSAWNNMIPAVSKTPEIADDAIARNIAFLKEFTDQKITVAPEKVFTNAYQPK